MPRPRKNAVRKPVPRAVAELEALEPEQDAPTSDDVLGNLAAALGQMAKNKGNRDAKMDEVAALLSSLSVKDYPELAEHPAVLEFIEQLSQTKTRNSADPPGTIYNPGSLAQYKKPWTWADVNKMPTETFIPPYTEVVFFNGLPFKFTEQEQVTAPAPFVAIYKDMLKAKKVAREHAEYLFRQRDSVSDPTILTMAGAYARATGDHGWYQPGAGVIAGAAPEPKEGDSGEAA